MPLSLTSPASCSSPVIDSVIKRKRQLVVSRQKAKWGLANLLGAILLMLESSAPSFHLIAPLDSPWRYWLSSFELTVSLILMLNAIADWYCYLFPLGLSAEGAEITLSPLKMKLLGVSEQDCGFKATPPMKQKDSKQHPYGFGSPLNGSFISPQASSPFSGNMSSVSSSSWMYQGNSPRDMSSAEKNRDYKPNLSMNGTFTDENSLNHFLSVCEEKDKIQEMTSGFNTSRNENGGLWGTSSAVGGGDQSKSINQSDHRAILSNVSYQLSTPMPFSPDAAKSGSPSGPLSPLSGSDTKSISLCRRVGIDPLDLVFWMQNIRIWISTTIVNRVVKEIDSMNDCLTKSGLGDSLIGTVGVERLRKCAALPQVKSQLMELNHLLAFLSITTHQEYLVHRLRELAQGGAMSAYKWNNGGRFKGNEWTDKLPCDAEIIMGCFAAYMDTRMPANFRNASTSTEKSINYFLEEKPFTGVFYVTSKSEATKSDMSNRESAKQDQQSLLTSAPRSIVIVQQPSERPPHFVLLIDGKERLEVSRGRHNLFHTLLFFLHHIKTKENGMLGRINLGVSGINILWTIDKE